MKDFSPIISPLCLVRLKGLSWTVKHSFYGTISSDAPLRVPEEPTMRKRTKENRKKSSTWWALYQQPLVHKACPLPLSYKHCPTKHKVELNIKPSVGSKVFWVYVLLHFILAHFSLCWWCSNPISFDQKEMFVLRSSVLSWKIQRLYSLESRGDETNRDIIFRKSRSPWQLTLILNVFQGSGGGTSGRAMAFCQGRLF